MLIRALPFTIYRDKKSGKKVYRYKGESLNTLPNIKWSSLSLLGSNINLLNYSFAIIPQSNLIVIDCDSEEATTDIDNIIAKYSLPRPLEIISDKGFKHYYYKPSSYAKTKIVGANRVKFQDIDYLQGQSMVFGFGVGNATKSVHYNPYSDPTRVTGSDIKGNLTPEIPKEIVDYLLSLRSEQQIVTPDLTKTDYRELAELSRLKLLGPKIAEWLKRYSLTGNYEDIKPIMEEYCPYKYRKMLEPSFHPDNIPEGEGINYLQALTAKLGADPSISLEQAEEIITIIATKLWSQPLPETQLDSFLQYIPRQYYPDGQPVFIYDPATLEDKVTAITPNNLAYTVVETVDGYAVVTQGYHKRHKRVKTVKSHLLSLGDVYVNSVRVDKKAVLTNKFNQVLDEKVPFVTLLSTPKYQAGLTQDRYENVIYNTFEPSNYEKIVTGLILKDIAIGTQKTRPEAITKLFHNLMFSLSEEKREEVSLNLDYFIRTKLLTNEHTPIVFHLMGSGGTGKDTIIQHLLTPLFNSTGYYNINQPSRFNAHYADKRIVSLPEVIVNKRIRNEIKQLSGADTVSIEEKGVTPWTVDNVATYILTTNSPTPLSETVADRRVVVFNSFGAPMLNLGGNNDVPKIINSSLIEYALYLRDLDITNPKSAADIHQIYTNALSWGVQETIEEVVEMDMAHTEYHSTHEIAQLYKKLSSVATDSPREEMENAFMMLLETIGNTFRVGTTGNRRGKAIKIPLYHKYAKIIATGEDLTKAPKKRDIIAAGIPHTAVKRDTNFKIYSGGVYELVIEISHTFATYIEQKLAKMAEAQIEDI